MARSTIKGSQALFHYLLSAYTATPTSLKVMYLAVVGFFPFNSFLSGVLSCVGTAVLTGFATRASFCGFCSLQPGARCGDYEFPWLKSAYYWFCSQSSTA